MPFLAPTPYSPHPTRNAMLRAIAQRLETEADRLHRLSVEINFRDSIAAGDVTAATSQLTATIAALTAITTEIADSHSLALVDSAPPSAWAGTAIIAGGIDRLGG